MKLSYDYFDRTRKSQLSCRSFFFNSALIEKGLFTITNKQFKLNQVEKIFDDNSNLFSNKAKVTSCYSRWIVASTLPRAKTLATLGIAVTPWFPGSPIAIHVLVSRLVFYRYTTTMHAPLRYQSQQKRKHGREKEKETEKDHQKKSR